MISELRYLFPNINFETDCEIVDNGSGLMLRNWCRPEPMPTQEEIQAVSVEAAISDARSQIAPVSAAQFQLALLDLDLLDGIEAYITNNGDRAMQLDWAKRQTYERNHPRIEQMRVLLGKTDAEVDAVFALAATK